MVKILRFQPLWFGAKTLSWAFLETRKNIFPNSRYRGRNLLDWSNSHCRSFIVSDRRLWILSPNTFKSTLVRDLIMQGRSCSSAHMCTWLTCWGNVCYRHHSFTPALTRDWATPTHTVHPLWLGYNRWPACKATTWITYADEAARYSESESPRSLAVAKWHSRRVWMSLRFWSAYPTVALDSICDSCIPRRQMELIQAVH